jgi:Zn ribbon nucleic-acid-binding protein
MEPIKVKCPHCGANECFEETQTMPDNTTVKSYMCVSCGYTSTTLNEVGSQVIKHYEENTAEIIKDLKWVDPNTNLIWYPIVLNFPSFGIIFPDGTGVHDWTWKAAPAIDIPEEDQKKYPIPGETDKFYTRKVNMEAGKSFAKDDFYNACKFLGFIQS